MSLHPRITLLLLAALLPAILHAQIRFPYSSQSEVGCLPCPDTVKVLFIKKVFDTGRLLPEWKPVLHGDSLTAFEGRVVPASEVNSSCHISPLDFSGYHYTHDLSFDAVPDAAYRHLLAQRIYEQPGKAPDTILQTALHCEWESGIAAGNESNPLAPAMRAGNSAGFLTAGHTRRQRLWNMPTIGDWLHLEGLWIWDRGHPPARTEIHPIRFMGIVRNLPDLIPATPGGPDSVFATRTDIFASGDGGALMNNRPSQPAFVHPVRMSAHNYTFSIRPRLPQPNPDATLRWRWEVQPGDNFPGQALLSPSLDSLGRQQLQFQLPWQNAPEDAVFARTLHSWWDTPMGKSPDLRIHTYEVKLTGIDILMRKEGLSRSEWRFFSDVGGQWLFLNEFLEGDDILKDDKASTYARKWPVDQTLRVHVPDGIAFRIFAGGWEADGMDKCFGEILDMDAPCTKQTRKALRKHLLPATPLGASGCLDDILGVAHTFPTPQALGEGGEARINSTGHPEDYDYCPGKSGIQNDCFTLKYTTRRINTR